MEASDILAFYASHGPMTDPREASALIEPLPHDATALARVIQGLGIYDVVARDFYGFEPPENRLSEIHLRPSRPRPLVCDSAKTTAPSFTLSRASFSMTSLVEVVSSKTRMSRPKRQT